MTTFTYRVITRCGRLVIEGEISAATPAAAKGKVRRMRKVSVWDFIYVTEVEAAAPVDMRTMRNYERHPIHRGVYLAYDGDGLSFRAKRAAHGGFAAWASHGAAASDFRTFHAETLKGVAAMVAASRRSA